MYRPNNKKNQLSKDEQRELLYHAHAARIWREKNFAREIRTFTPIKNNWRNLFYSDPKYSCKQRCPTPLHASIDYQNIFHTTVFKTMKTIFHK
jgi:hypothetical protein